MTGADRYLDVTADLILRVDNQRVTVTSAPGGPVTIEVADPAALWATVRGVVVPVGVTAVRPRRAAGQAADLLAAAGVQTVVSGPTGPLVTLGRDVDSVTGRLVFGNRHVRPGTWGALAPSAQAVIRSSIPRRERMIGLVGAAALVVAVAVGRLRARGRR